MKLHLALLRMLPILLILAGCNFPAVQPMPTPLPSAYIPTAIALTARALSAAVRSPDQTSTPTGSNTALDGSPDLTGSVWSPNQTSTPTGSVTGSAGSPGPTTPTPTPSVPSSDQTKPAPITPTAPAGIPIAAIQILRPGPMSLVTSPFLLQTNLLPEAGGHVQVELLGEDGRLLMRKIQIYNQAPGARLDIPFEVNFEISAVAETARLQVSVVDEHGRNAALASVDLLLLSLGEPSQNPPGDLLESIVIQEPRANALVQGGMLRVSGLARPRSDLPLMIELHADDGKIVGTRQVAVDNSGEGHYGTFAIDVPYSVPSAVPIRLVVWERGAQIPGIVRLSSLEVLLSP